MIFNVAAAQKDWEDQNRVNKYLLAAPLWGAADRREAARMLYGQ